METPTYHQQYYQLHKDTINAQALLYKSNNKDDIKAKNIVYKSNHIQQRRDTQNAYRHKKGKFKCLCECGGVYSRFTKIPHLKSKKHIEYGDTLRSAVSPDRKRNCFNQS